MGMPWRDGPEIGEALRSHLGPVRPVRRLASSPRSRVWLVEVDGAPAVVKQIVGGEDAAERFAREVTALGLAGRVVRPAVVPAVLGTYEQERVLVLEHLPSLTPAEDWAVDYARALARLHASTSPDDAGLLPAQSGPDAEDVAAFIAMACYLEVPVSARAETQLGELCERLAAPRGHALLHGDPCPGNDLHTGDGVRFVDLEGAALGDGLTELAYLRIGFPTCWCVTEVAAPLLAEAEEAYCAERRAAGTAPDGDLTDACAGWLIQGDALVERAHRRTTDQLTRATREDWTWGTTSARGRLVHRTAIVAALAREGTPLADVGRLCGTLHDSMLRRWPAVARAPIPALRTFAS